MEETMIRYAYFLGFAVMLVTGSARTVSAELFTYVDKDGQIAITDSLQSIPEEKRTTAKTAGNDSPTAASADDKAPVVHRNPPAEDNSDRPMFDTLVRQLKGNAPDSAGSFVERLILSAVIVITAACVLIILRKFDSEEKKAIAITRVAILWVVSLYVVVAHTGDVVRMFSSIGGGIEEVQKTQEEKGKRAAASMKRLNQMLDSVEQNAAGQADAHEKE
jgi:hypothetical protein